MKGKVYLLIVVLLISGSGCATMHEFKEASKSSLHATIIFREFRGAGKPLGPHRAYPIEINGKKPSFWKWTYQTFLIPEGKIIILVGARLKNLSLTAYEFIEFEAEYGEKYYIDAEERIKDVVFTVRNTDGTPIFTKTASKVPAPRNTSTYMPIVIPSQ